MKITDDYIRNIKNLFFISVDNDIESWQKNGSYFKLLISPLESYDNLTLDTIDKKLILNSNLEDITISEYGGFFRNNDKKISKYEKILINHFKQLDEIKMNNNKIKALDKGINCLIEKYKKEYDKYNRKNKLEKLNDK